MNPSLPPIPVPNPAKAPIQVISSDRSSRKKVLYIVFSILLGLVGIGIAVYLIGFKQLLSPKAYDCSTYKFNVSQNGEVTVINGSASYQSSQKVSVSVNGSPTGILDVPALSAGASANLGQVSIPVTKEFTWDAVGTIACASHGSYTANLNPTATPQALALPTSTPLPSPSPIPTQPVVAYVLPTSVAPTDVPVVYLSPSPTPPAKIIATGAVENTFILGAAAVILIGLGTLLAF